MEEKTQVPFSGTLAQELQLKELIAAHKEQPGCLMPVLQQAQEIYGYLPIEVQAIVAEGLGISLSEVLEAVERKLGIQVGECTPDGLFSLESCRCVGACGLAPVMMINDEVFGRMTPEQVPVILEDYARKGGVPV